MMFMLSHVWLFATPRTVAHQAPLFMEFSRQEHWSRLPFPPPGIYQAQRVSCTSCIGRQILYHTVPLGSPCNNYKWIISFKNRESLHCIPVTYIFFKEGYYSFKKIFFKVTQDWSRIFSCAFIFLCWVKETVWRREIEKMTWMTKRDGLLHSSSSTLSQRDPDTQTEQPWLLKKDKDYFQKKHLHHRCLA